MEARDGSVEFSARTVEDAIAEGLAALGKSEDQVEITVLSRGSRGLLGLGAENARVRIVVKPPAAPVQLAPEAPPPLVGAPTGSVEDTARQVLSDLVRLMGMPARVQVRSASSGLEVEEGAFVLDITGADVSTLIGRRGETLAALQYLCRQMVGHKTGQWVPFVVDVEQYKDRRQQSLRSLALRMADRVVSTGQAVALEAMPPSERRIVHLALRDHASVITKSIGEGENRKVMILPKE